MGTDPDMNELFSTLKYYLRVVDFITILLIEPQPKSLALIQAFIITFFY